VTVFVKWQNGKRMDRKGGLGYPMGQPLGPTDQGRPLNFRAKFKWALHKVF